MLRRIALYSVTIVMFLCAVLLVLYLGSDLPAGKAEPVLRSGSALASGAQEVSLGSAGDAFRGLLAQLRHPFAVLLMQMIVIVAAARLMGGLFRKIGQPSVVGEMVAGVLLGSSLLGLLWPESQHFLFPRSSMPTLHLFSQVGIIVYMFLVGIDLDLGHLRQKAHAAILVSHASIAIPFFLGTALCLLIYPAVAPSNVAFAPFALFLGIAMSITAFPVLARVVEERGLMNSYLGSTAIACAAVDDVTAWCLLALVVAIGGASGVGGAVVTLILSLCFIVTMLCVVRPLMARFVDQKDHLETNSQTFVAILLVFAFASALITEVIGIHALFGAFLAGAIMPANARLRSLLRARMETFTSVLLLPLFFAFTGLRTQIGLLADLTSWMFCAGIILVAIIGKLGGSALAARSTGIGWRDSLAIGVLMNTRGLMELIVLNIGYEMGILSPQVFAMMVLMALTTTFMAGPMLSLLRIQAPDEEAGNAHPGTGSSVRV